jgi:hypothetical protein
MKRMSRSRNPVFFAFMAGQVQFDNGIVSVETTGDGIADFQIKRQGVTALHPNSLILA